MINVCLIKLNHSFNVLILRHGTKYPFLFTVKIPHHHLQCTTCDVTLAISEDARYPGVVKGILMRVGYGKVSYCAFIIKAFRILFTSRMCVIYHKCI